MHFKNEILILPKLTLKTSLTKSMISIQENLFKDNKNFFPIFKNNRPIIKYVTIMQVCSFNCLPLEATKIFVSQIFYPNSNF